MADSTAHDLLALGGLLDTTALARVLGVSKRSLQNRRLSKNDFVPAIKIGRSLRYDPRDVAAFIAKQREDRVSDPDNPVTGHDGQRPTSKHASREVEALLANRLTRTSSGSMRNRGQRD